ncbi:unnamed protein product [Closterium sp. NIES-54]
MLLFHEGDPDALDITTPRSYAEAITGEYSSQWQTAMDTEMASWKSTGTYVDAVPPLWANIVDVMWIVRVKRLFAPSTANPALFLRTDSSLPLFYIRVYVDDLVFATADTLDLQRFGFRFSSPQSTPLPTGHSLSAPPSDESVERVVSIHSFWVASLTQRSSQGYTFSLGSGSVFRRSTHSSSVLSLICEAEIYAGAMAAQELRWLTYLLTDLGERPHSLPVLYVNNEAMIALCQEQRLEHKRKHIAPR